MSDFLNVVLHDRKIGELIRYPNGSIRVEFDEAYRTTHRRNTLSQFYLDSAGELLIGNRRSRAGKIPPFFSNLLPEGKLRTYIANQIGLKDTREFELVEYLGMDLPGAIEMRSGFVQHREIDDYNEHPKSDFFLRFSLSGVQLKVPAVRQSSGRFTIPAHGVGGDWIIKLPSREYPGLVENEFAMMKIAAQLGISVPATELLLVRDIQGLPSDMHDPNEPVQSAAWFFDSHALAVKRFDRSDGNKIHMEDFCQVYGLVPDSKYDPQHSNTSILSVLAGDQTQCEEFARRWMFTALIGNGDMHLKNWSLLYPDKVNPILSPAYDLLCSTAYIRNDQPALKTAKRRNWKDLDKNALRDLANECQIDYGMLADAAADTIALFHDEWSANARNLPIRYDVKTAIERQLKLVPLVGDQTLW